MAIIVATVVMIVLAPPRSPYSTLATPMSPRAPGTRSQKAGRKLTRAGGPVRCRAMTTATGVIAAAPTSADSTPSKRTSPSTCAP